MKLSIVSTLYYSAPYIDEFYRRICQAAASLGMPFEIIFVNDGSPDNSAEVVLKLRELDPRVCLIDLSRNFGHHKAIMTGLSFATGDLVFLIDVDLEEPPELLGTFYAKLRSGDADVVYGIRGKREDKFWTQLFARMYWRFFSWLSDVPIPSHQLTARLMTRRYVAGLLQFRDQEVFLPGLWVINGFKQVGLPAKKGSRGKSTYTFSRRLGQMVDSITAFSTKPLFLIFNLGLLIVGLAAGAGAYLIVRRLFFNDLLAGWPSLMVTIWFLGGLTLFSLGIIGIYLAKTYHEVKRRPLTIVRAVYRGENISSLSGEVPDSSSQDSVTHLKLLQG